MNKEEIIKDKSGKPIYAGEKFKFKYLENLNRPIELVGAFSWSGNELRYEIDIFNNSNGYECLSYVPDIMYDFELISEPLHITDEGLEIRENDLLFISIDNEGEILKFDWDQYRDDEDKKGYFGVFKKNNRKLFSSWTEANKHLKSLKPKVGYTTEDGYEVKEGENPELHGIRLSCSERDCYYSDKYTPLIYNYSYDGCKWFFDKNNARNYLAQNYPFFSLQDIEEKVWIRIQEIAKQKALDIIPE